VDRGPLVIRKQQDATAEAIQALPATSESWLTAVRAAESKKAHDITVLDLREVTSFADSFIICTGNNARQNQAISDEIYLKLKHLGELPISLEGYDNAEWILMDYGDFLIHIFLPATREFYDLERLWRHAKKVDVPAEGPVRVG
jgi:ribosome-associated protein